MNQILYNWIDRRNRIPAWVRLVYRYAHWCSEMDGLLILTREDAVRNCFCDRRPVDRAAP